MVAADTNVLVRVLARDNAPQVAAAEAFISRGAWVSLVVLVEAMWVLWRVYKFDHDEIAAAIEMLLEHDRFVLQDPTVVEGALTLYRDRPSLGFSDCLILEIARKAGHLPLGTFDRALGRAAGATAI